MEENTKTQTKAASVKASVKPKPVYGKETGAPAVTADAENREPLLRNNYIVMAIAGVLIVLGFALMTGGNSGVEEYNPDIFSQRRIVVGPLLSFIGYVVMAVAIVLKPKK